MTMTKTEVLNKIKKLNKKELLEAFEALYKKYEWNNTCLINEKSAAWSAQAGYLYYKGKYDALISQQSKLPTQVGVKTFVNSEQVIREAISSMTPRKPEANRKNYLSKMLEWLRSIFKCSVNIVRQKSIV